MKPVSRLAKTSDDSIGHLALERRREETLRKLLQERTQEHLYPSPPRSPRHPRYRTAGGGGGVCAMDGGASPVPMVARGGCFPPPPQKKEPLAATGER